MCERSRQVIPGLLRKMTSLEMKVAVYEGREKLFFVAFVICLIMLILAGFIIYWLMKKHM
jgi:hypothetical protein